MAGVVGNGGRGADGGACGDVGGWPPADDDADHMLVRTIECTEGRVDIELICEPVFDYGRQTASWVFAFPNPTQPSSITASYIHTAYLADLDLGDAGSDSDDPLVIDVELQPTGRSTFSTVSA